MSDKTNAFDLVVIGSGPGGYVAAIRAAQLGMSVACVERDTKLGGTCLNVGCIPSKALLNATEEYVHAKKILPRHGVVTEDVHFDLPLMMSHKQKVVDDLTKGIEHLFKKNDITRFVGLGRLGESGEVCVETEDGEVASLSARTIVIATGSTPTSLKELQVDETRILTSTGALSMTKVPEQLAVIGAGYIGLEMASIWSRLGAKVTVIEYLDKILPGMDDEVTDQFYKLLRRQKIKFQLGTRVKEGILNENEVELILESVSEGVETKLKTDVALIAIGRRPFTEGLGLNYAGVKLNEIGQIEVNDRFETSVSGIYAIGDVIRGPMLAHKAEDEGIAVSEIIGGLNPKINYEAIPSVVYTQPELASVGYSEEQLQVMGLEYSVGKFPFVANGRARAMSATEGFVKILADKNTDRLLGVHILGADAGTIIAEAVLAIELGASAEDMARTCHAHPTLNEGVKEAALAYNRRAIHI